MAQARASGTQRRPLRGPAAESHCRWAHYRAALFPLPERLSRCRPAARRALASAQAHRPPRGGGCTCASELPDKELGRVVDELAAARFRRWLMAADGRIVHDAGGTEAQELAYVLASGVAMLRALEAGGIALEDARHMLYFRLTADTDQFITIAKLRALRRLWQRVEGSCGLAPEPAFISAETAWRTITRNDSTMNIVRATIAIFAAAVGGADAMTVLPFTAARGLPDGFARRIARNTQL